MARVGRRSSSTGIYHIMLRAKDKLFINPADHEVFLGLLSRYLPESIFSYALTDTRAHLIASVPRSPAEKIKPICTSYARYFNRTYKTNGKLFYDRFSSEPILDGNALFQQIEFLHAVTTSDLSSLSEYDGLPEICNVVRAKQLMLPCEKILCMDDYSRISNAEIISCLTRLLDVNPLSETGRASALTAASTQLSRQRICSIFGNLPTSADETTQQKKELSFWLL